jgi:hypothetical protein
MVRSEPPASTKAAGTLKCQQYHKDIAGTPYTTGQCLIGKDNLGVSVPVAKPSNDNLYIKAMVIFSSLLKHHVFQDRKDTVSLDTVNTTHGHDFAKELHPDNVLEALQST